MKFPPLLAAVNSRLERQLEFSDAYRSMQLARNCLEHRNGIVGTADVQHDGIMRLQFPRLVAFIERNGEQMELHSGMAVEAGENILMKLEVKIRQFALGERLSLSAADFDEIAFACSHFAGELARSLPRSSPTPAIGTD